MKLVYLLHSLIVILVLPAIGYSQIQKRNYKPGDHYKYKLTTEVWRNDQYNGKTVSISDHQVVNDNGVLAEEIKWLSKISYNATDSARLDEVAKKVAPYRISLSPNGKVLLPKLTVPEMIGEVTDLNTFFVAIAPDLNAQKLTAKAPHYKNKEPKQGNFADSITILYGTDCIEVSQHFIGTDKKYTRVRTDFTPPATFCLTPLLDTVTKQKFNAPNNFQMIQPATEGKFNFFWGVEYFTITTKIDNVTGAIVSASMENGLTLQMRYNSSPDLKTYAVEMPVKIKRLLKLELLQ